jgi:ABC-2 type transport system permease protein
MLPIIFLVPIVQLVILVYAANLEMKEIDLYIVDQDNSPISNQLKSKFNGSPFFNISYVGTLAEAEDYMFKGKADAIMYIPNDFEKNLLNENYSDLQLLFNAINGTVASISNAYCKRIISEFNQDIIINSGNTYPELANLERINMEESFWYNPELDYKIYMSSGILVLLVTIISMFLSGMNLVREKETGTAEQINVTPIHKYQFIAGKLIPFLIIALFELAFGLALAKILFDLPMLGSLVLLFAMATVYLITTLAFGLFVSTMANTQQQVMFVAFFFMIVFILMSGIFTPVESMPEWAQKLNYINPVAWFMRIVRMILLKGSGFSDIKTEFFALVIYGLTMLSLAVWRYRKTS